MDTGQARRNPITGDGDAEPEAAPSRRPARGSGAAHRVRNPITDGDNISEYSEETPLSEDLPRFLLGDRQKYPPRPQSAGSGFSHSTARSTDMRSLRSPGDWRDSKRAAKQQGAPEPPLSAAATAAPPDARAMAARALGPGDVVKKLKDKIIARGGTNGIKGLGRLLRIMDDNGDKRLSRDELIYGLRDYGISVTKTEIEQLFLYFDRDHNGFIDIDEFLIGIRGDLNDRRKSLIRMAFDILDIDGSGMVTVDELAAVYDVSWNPAVRAGKITEDEALKEFMAQWDRLDGDGMVSIEEFEDYYKGVSSSIDGDDYFELMIRNAWRIPGGVGMAANTANKRVLVTNRDGSQKVVTVQNELGMKPGDRDAVRGRLAQQGLDPVDIELHGGMDTTEKAVGGMKAKNEAAARLEQEYKEE
ncbi:Capsl, partial [Symbiodinium microadriaticum]